MCYCGCIYERLSSDGSDQWCAKQSVCTGNPILADVEDGDEWIQQGDSSDDLYDRYREDKYLQQRFPK